MTGRIFALVILAAGLAAPSASAQFSSDIPGIPRASVPIRGNHQNRTVWDLSYFKGEAEQTGTTTGASAQDTLGFGLRLGLGQSYRIGARLEVGYDVTLGNGLYVSVPQGTSTTRPGGGSAASNDYARGLFLYGLRLGAKFRPIQVLSPEGYGYEAAVGASIRPSLRPVFGFTRERDTTFTGGLVAKEDPQKPSRTGIFDRLQQTYQVAGMVSYRARRFLFDAAAVYEEALQDPDSSATAVQAQHTGFSPRAGGLFRLTPGIAAGVSWWGAGASPWYDHVQDRTPAERKSTFAPVVSFGSTPEKGADFILAAPTGSYLESARLYVRFRSTR